MKTNTYSRITKSWLNASQTREDTWKLSTTEMGHPEHRDAFLGNGYMGIRVPVEGSGAFYPDARTVVNGIYRNTALIGHPRWFAVDVRMEGTSYNRNLGTHEYLQTLDMKKCVLTTQDTWELAGGKLELCVTIFPHRQRPHLLVMAFELRSKKDCVVRLVDSLDAKHLSESSDHVFDEGRVSSIIYRIPDINLTECVSSVFQASVDTTETIQKNDRCLTRRLDVPLKRGRKVTIYRYASLHTSRDSASPQESCRKELEEVLAFGYDAILEEHRKAWEQLWESDIIVENPRIQRMIHAALFQMYCHFREGYHHSIGPVGLSGDAWGGRVFWDADLWVFPPLALLHPELGRSIVEYRLRTLDGARHDAEAEGRRGAKFAWESGATGVEETPWFEAREQRHLQNDVSLAQWQYFLCSGDEDYLRTKALEVIIESANFWVDRVIYNEEKDRYEIHDVVCADEFAVHKNNNAFTNYGAAVNLRLAASLCRRFGLDVPKEWEEIANNLFLPFDDENKRYLEHDTYNGEIIKQADTSLLVYPYEMPMSDEIKANIVKYYSGRLPEEHIMMSSAIDLIVSLEIGQTSAARNYFYDLLPHFRPPYWLVSESPSNETLSFVTGLGGFLQVFLNGFAGIRIHEDGLLVSPSLPEGWTRMEIRGLHFAGEKVNLLIKGTAARVTAERVPGFRLYDRSGNDVPARATPKKATGG